MKVFNGSSHGSTMKMTLKKKTGFSRCKTEFYQRLKVEDNTIFLGYDFWVGLDLINIKQNYMEWAGPSRLLCGLGLGLALLNINWAGLGWAWPY